MKWDRLFVMIGLIITFFFTLFMTGSYFFGCYFARELDIIDVFILCWGFVSILSSAIGSYLVFVGD